MSLNEIVKNIRNFEGIRRKQSIYKITDTLKETLNYGSVEIIAAFGEDSAVFKVPEINDYYFLIAMDGMWYKLLEANPILAGYFSILVNANDIYCKGGKPLVMVNNLGINDIKNGQKIISGIIEGCKKFKVPMVGGHLHPDEDRLSLAVSVLGIVPQNQVILSSTAEVGNRIIIATDLDGNFDKDFIFAWDTTSHKNSEQVSEITTAMSELAQENLLTAAKDISNPGNIGTLGMLLETSNVGARVSIENIPKPPEISMTKWVKAYPGFGIVATTRKNNVKKCIEIFENRGIKAKDCGEIIEEKRLLLNFKNDEQVLFDFNVDKITGLK